jgi:hypothetical protein
MLLSTKRIPTKYLIIGISVIVLIIVGYNYAASGFSYKLKYTRQMPELREDIKLIVHRIYASEGMSSYPVDVDKMCEISNDIVATRLSYDYSISCTDPNKVWDIQKVNCTGYAALQVSILNYMFKQYAIRGTHAEWHSGDVYYCGQFLGRYLGHHCYPFVYCNGYTIYPDACLKDLVFDGFLVKKEER